MVLTTYGVNLCIQSKYRNRSATLLKKVTGTFVFKSILVISQSTFFTEHASGRLLLEYQNMRLNICNRNILFSIKFFTIEQCSCVAYLLVSIRILKAARLKIKVWRYTNDIDTLCPGRNIVNTPEAKKSLIQYI